MLVESIAEFIGTFIFLFIILQQGQPIPIAVGLLAAIYAFGNISGGHFNPAVTIMMGADQKVSPKQALLYIIAQIAGGLCAVMLHNYISRNSKKKKD